MIAALFPGQNSHAVGMGSLMRGSLFRLRAGFRGGHQALPGITSVMQEGPLENTTLTANQQPALVTASIAAYRAWQEATGLTPAYAVGHSLAKYGPCGCRHPGPGRRHQTGAQTGHLHARSRPSRPGGHGCRDGRGHRHHRAGLPDTPGVAEVANFNAPTHTVIGGEVNAVQAASAELKSKKGLQSDSPESLCPLSLHPDVFCPGKTAGRSGEHGFPSHAVPGGGQCDRPENHLSSQAPSLLSQQVTGSVRFVESIQKLLDLGVTEFVEFGSGTGPTDC